MMLQMRHGTGNCSFDFCSSSMPLVVYRGKGDCLNNVRAGGAVYKVDKREGGTRENNDVMSTCVCG